MAKDTTLMESFKFDDDNADWSFGATAKPDKTNVAQIVPKVKAGTTIDEDEDDDNEGEATNLEKAEDNNEDDNEDVSKVLPKKQAVAKEVEEKPKKDKIEEEEEEEEEEEDKEEDEPEFFENKKVDKKTGTKSTEKQEVVEEPDEEKFYTDLASELKEKGIFEHVEIPKDKVLTEDEFLELHDEEIEARVGESLEAFVEDMSTDAKDLIKHLKRGGSVASFVDAYAGSGIDYDKFDADDEAQRDALIRFYVQTVENVEPEDVEDRLQALKDSGKDKAKAEQWVSKLKKIEDKQKEDFQEAEKERKATKKEANKKFNDALLEVISKSDSINDFPINKETQKKLPSFFTKPSVKVGKDNYITPFQAKLGDILRGKNKENREKLVLLGALLDNDFDFSAITPKAETKVVKRANNILQRSKLGAIKASTAGSYANRVLADAFGNDE